MIAPFPLYVDEIDPGKIKATVSSGGAVLHNIKMMLLDMPFPTRDPSLDPAYRSTMVDRMGEEINGIRITSVGRFICLLAKNHGRGSMILLDLVGREELVAPIVEKLYHVQLERRFRKVYAEMISHPESHKRFKLVTGNVM
ncbi:MAG: hypothetical protein QM731_01665 [Chitinophagaceae bacterium]